MARRFLVSAILALPLLTLGNIKNCESCTIKRHVSKPAVVPPKEPPKEIIQPKEVVDETPKKFLGSWGIYDEREKRERTIDIESWEPGPTESPQKEFIVGGNIKMELVMPITVKGFLLVSFFGTRGMGKKSKGGIYKSPEGEYAIISWIEVVDVMAKIKMDGEDLMMKATPIKNTRVADDSKGWIRRKRIK